MGREGPRGRDLSALEVVLSPGEPFSGGDALAFWSALRDRARSASSWEAAVRGGALADRLGYAFLAGYEAALSALVPSRDRARVAALSATEVGGAHPRAIETRIEDGALTGAKTFVTMGDRAEELFVLAKRGEAGEGRADLAMVRVDRAADGVVIEPLPPAPFVPEIPHAKVRFEGVRAFEVLPGDGWSDYVRPFRTVEDVHVYAACLAWIGASLARRGVEREAIARAAAILASLEALAGSDPSRPSTHVALAGAIDLTRALVRDLEPSWASASEDDRARWQRDRALLDVAGKARAARLEKAWAALASR